MALLLNKISNKIRNHAEWWTDYMTEMSILVISLAATFYGESLIEGYNEAKDDKATMEMVVEELEYNLTVLAEMEQQYVAELDFANILKRALVQHESFSQDTLDTYKNFHRMYYYTALKMNAFDYTKVSGVMQRVEDKQLVVRLYECYELLDILKQLHVDFREERRVKLSAFVAGLVDGEHGATTREQWRQIDEDSHFKHYLLYSGPSLIRSIIAQIRVLHENINETILSIKAGYGLD